MFRETASLKHGVKQSKRHDVPAESIARTGCPKSTPIAECCLDATSTNDLTCKRRRAEWHLGAVPEAISTTGGGTVGKTAGAVEARHNNRTAQNDGADYANVSRTTGHAACTADNSTVGNRNSPRPLPILSLWESRGLSRGEGCTDTLPGPERPTRPPARE
jgi:hypothetical protein